MTDPAAVRVQSGPLPWELLRFGTPIALGMGLQTTFNLVDAYLISRLDHDVKGPALGAIGICDQLAALGTIVSYGVSIATAASVSRKYGARDFAGARHVAWQSLLVVLALGAAFGALGSLGAPLVMHQLVGAKGQVAELGTEYLRVIVGGSVSIFLLLHLTTLMRALGSSKTPILLLAFANVLNFVLAVLLIFGPGPAPPAFGWGPPLAEALGLPRLELMGAAWATIIARLVVLAPLIAVLVSRFELFRSSSRKPPDMTVLGSLIGLAWPSSAQLVVRIAAMLFVHSLVARAYTTAFDQSATTALGIVFRLETMALFVSLGWGSAAQTFVGQNLGAGKRRRAEQSGWYAALFNAVMMGLLAMLYLAFGRQLVAFFDSDPRVVETGRSYLQAVAVSYVGLGVGIALGAAIQGAGAMRQTLALDAWVVLAFQLPASVLVVSGLQLEPERLWQVVALTYWGFALVYCASYRRGRFLEAVIA